MKETPLKYVKVNASKCDIVAPGNFRIAITGTEKDARRIVAAVNAVEGISTKALEAAFEEGIGLDFTRPVKAELESSIPAINARLLEVLKEADEYLSENKLNQIGHQSILHSKMIAAIAEAETNAPDQHIIAAQLQAFSAEIHYIRQISHLQNSIQKFVTASQFAMRLLSQNEGDALAQSCITQLAQAINAVATFGTGPMIQERPRLEEPEMPDYSTND